VRRLRQLCALALSTTFAVACGAGQDPTLGGGDAASVPGATTVPAGAAVVDPFANPPTTIVGGLPAPAPPPPAPPPPAPPAPAAAVDSALVGAGSGGRPRPAGEPVALGAQIVAAERAVRDPATPPDVLAAAGHLQQVAYRLLGDHPEWDATVLGAAPAELHDAITRNVAARREFATMARRVVDTVPAWRIVDPLPAPELRALYAEAEAAHGVPWHVLAAVNLVETGMGRIQGLSSAGAQGPMQFIPSTWAAFGMGGDINDPHDAIMGAANYLAANGGAEGTDGGIDNALFRYNNANAYVRAVRHYSAIMAADEAAYRGFHAWQIYYRSVAGDLWFPTGYEQASSLPVAEWLAANPQ
jgi:hypothetical protein